MELSRSCEEAKLDNKVKQKIDVLLDDAIGDAWEALRSELGKSLVGMGERRSKHVRHIRESSRMHGSWILT